MPDKKKNPLQPPKEEKKPKEPVKRPAPVINPDPNTQITIVEAWRPRNNDLRKEIIEGDR